MIKPAVMQIFSLGGLLSLLLGATAIGMYITIYTYTRSYIASE